MIVINFIIVLGILIFVHELGHFLVAKWMGVRVEKFSLGFGPKLFGKKLGETEYLVSAFPLGGYVKMFGESGYIEGSDSEERELTEEEKKVSFFHKPPLARIAIVAAGPAFNIIFAWILYVALYTSLSINGHLYLPAKVGSILPHSPAEKAGLQKGDIITAIDGKAVSEFGEIALLIFKAAPAPVQLKVQRGSQQLDFTITPMTKVEKDPSGSNKPVERPVIGIGASKDDLQKSPFSFTKALRDGTQRTFTVMQFTIISLKKLMMREISLDNLGGPINIAKQADANAKSGMVELLGFMALISVNLGIMNLFPVPVLDGGHLVFYTIELVFRRPVTIRIREYAQQIGVALLLAMMLLAFYNDIMRYFFN